MLNDIFYYDNLSNTLSVEEVSFVELANSLGTPTYVYSLSALKRNFTTFVDACKSFSPLICVSVKANSNLSLLSILSRYGAGFDIVSGGELKRVLAVGANPKSIVFSGVGKTDSEIRLALKSGILMFNVESAEELARVNQIALEMATVASVALRVNPDVDAKTHAHINTGKEEHKFGIGLSEAESLYFAARNFKGVSFIGVDCHIGSMIFDLTTFGEAFQRLAAFIVRIKGHLPSLKYIDLGGGVGVSYNKSQNTPNLADYANLIQSSFSTFGLNIILEPGRWIFANAGVLLSRVVFVKNTPKKQFVIIDAGFNDLIRPLLYGAYHEIIPVQHLAGSSSRPVDIVGPICETGDCFAKDRMLEEVKQGDLLVLMSAGAYGFSMASNYNTRGRPAEVLVQGSKFNIIRPRESEEELFASEMQSLCLYKEVY